MEGCGGSTDLARTLKIAMDRFKIPLLGECSPAHLIAIFGRCVLGGFLIYMGLAKAFAPVDFLKLLREYHFLSSPFLLNAVAATLPWFEIFCGILLVTGIAARATSAMVAALFFFFSIAIAQRALALQSELHVSFCALSFDCGCGAGEVFVCSKLMENLAWIALALWLALSRHTPGRTFPWR